ncbi:c-type cytochrome [Vreelandella arctica]|uniref:c-type cytochrome n=1 Tax=Vreelandella arctica TaxID=3126499 RepID=UPI00300E368E
MNSKSIAPWLMVSAIAMGHAGLLLARDHNSTQQWQPTGAQNLKSGRSPHVNYSLHCAGCHGQNGTGVEHAGIPPFPGFINRFFEDEEGRLYLMHVPGVVGAGMPNNDIASVMNYLVDRWGQADQKVNYFTEEEVDNLRSQEVADVVELRRSITQRLASEGVELPEYPWP